MQKEPVADLIFNLSDFLNTDTVERKVSNLKCDIDCDSDISVNVRVLKISNAEKVYVSGSISGSLSLECSLCLNTFLQPINIAISTDIDFLGGVVDLNEEIRQLILLDMPMKPVCSKECLGICSVCGKHKKEGDSCLCENKQEDYIKERWENLFKR